uniref:Reverse transcriptase domain, reverse transcriptase zinc-binding domain protein n=1 Tax=Tanacetum cinerariifolium TaxID=118510 RepID=A0A6L2KW83_TANCI|nr:reverse transcriptase domain, reverse transcriptase zinc-binding domain protein [Tanacetum cinerariifolium]
MEQVGAQEGKHLCVESVERENSSLEELDRRGIDLDTTLCSCCDSVMESCVHSLVLCNFSMSVWEKIFNWWKLGNVNAFSIGEIFAANGKVVIPKYSLHLWQAVIWTSVYFIWKIRNERVFKGKVSSVTKIVKDIQVVRGYHFITLNTKCEKRFQREKELERETKRENGYLH